MIPGDHAGTAAAIGRMIDLANPYAVLTGADLDGMDDAALAAVVHDTDIFARTSPEHKLLLVSALQSHRLTVAMTGDGVNDAPALKRADAGIAVGKRGSEAAKEAAVLVLADDSFASIAAAVREGRTVYDSIKNVISWMLPTGAGQAMVIVMALLLGMTLPITPIQILWVNLVTAITLGLALAFELGDPDTMRRKPRRRDESLLGSELVWRIVLVALLFAAGVFAVFAYALDRGYPVELARTMAVNTLVAMEIAHLFFIRNVYRTSLTWQVLRDSKAVWLTVGLIVAAQIAITYVPLLRRVFGTHAMASGDVMIAVAVGTLLLKSRSRFVCAGGLAASSDGCLATPWCGAYLQKRRRPVKVLVLNAGSSSLKFAVFALDEGVVPVVEGEFKRFSAKGSLLVLNRNGAREEHSALACNLQEAIARVPTLLDEAGCDHFDAIGHRVAHGGVGARGAARITGAVLDDIRALVPLAPLHNPVNLQAIDLTRSLWPSVLQVAVFDTSFHHTIPAHAYTYAVPKKWRDHGVRRYGFHGISHQYVALWAAAALGQPMESLRMISCHLGSGASLCAISHGASIDTSMGMTPLEGLVMGTRSGDVDPGLFAYLSREFNLDAQTVERELYRASGLKALTGENDLQQIEQRAQQGDADAQLALSTYAYRVRKYIGAYAAAMGGVDAVIFTGGVGENSSVMRRSICQGLQFIGIHLDHEKNHALQLTQDAAVQVQDASSTVAIVVTKTHEQLMIAQEVYRLLRE